MRMARTLGGVIKLKHKLETQDDVERLRSSWKDKYSGGDKVGEIAVLEQDGDFDQFGMPFERCPVHRDSQIPSARNSKDLRSTSGCDR